MMASASRTGTTGSACPPLDDTLATLSSRNRNITAMATRRRLASIFLI